MCRRTLLTLVAVAGLVAAGCGAGRPSSPSAGAKGVAVQGVVLGDGAAFAASSETYASSAKAGKVTVKVEGTTITAEVSANGTFVLDDVPAGTFTLVFIVDGQEIGRIQVTAQDGDEVKIVVQVKNSGLTLLEMHVEHPQSGASPSPTACVIRGGTEGQRIELEGVVSPGGSWQQFDMTVNGERESGFVHVSADTATTSYRCVGGARVDSDDACKALIAVGGAQVHVRGMLSECTTMEAKVTASEVKIQKNR
jgi:hypothetical protein